MHKKSFGEFLRTCSFQEATCVAISLCLGVHGYCTDSVCELLKIDHCSERTFIALLQGHRNVVTKLLQGRLLNLFGMRGKGHCYYERTQDEPNPFKTITERGHESPRRS